MKHRYWSIGLIVCLLLLLPPLSARAATVESGICGAQGDNLTWTLDDEGTLTIGGTGAMEDWDEHYPPWLEYDSEIRFLIVEDSVTTIGNRAFYCLSDLESVTISNSVTSIGEEAFFDCTSLTNMTIPSGVTSIGKGTFALCTSLTSVTIPNSVTSIGAWAFESCTGLTSVTIPNSMTRIETGVFARCTGLTSVTIPNSVTSIGQSAFYNCAGLTSVTIGDSVTSIGDWAFESCASLTSVMIPNNVTSIGTGAFANCTDLTAITADGGNEHYKDIDGVLLSKDGTLLHSYPAGKTDASYQIPDGVKIINNSAISYTRNLESVVVPDSVETIFEFAFQGNEALTCMEIPDSVTNIYFAAFMNCRNLEAITVDDANPAYQSIDGVLFSKDGSTLYTYPMGKGGGVYKVPDGVQTIDSYAFHRVRLESVILPYGVRNIYEYAFAGCILTGIVLPNSLRYIGEDAFYYATLLGVYYLGAEEQWHDDELVIESGNDSLLNEIINYMDPTTASVASTGFFDLDENGIIFYYAVYSPVDATLYYAHFDEDGRFVGVEEAEIVGGSPESLSFSLKWNERHTRLMVVDDFGVPLCDGYENTYVPASDDD